MGVEADKPKKASKKPISRVQTMRAVKMEEDSDGESVISHFTQ